MSWKDRLQPASFRGISFGVDSGDLTAGRRIQTHEYPQRDKPYTEDLGRATRKISIEAFLIGLDFMEVRDRLLGAIETAGSGELIHPWHGRMMVNVDGECRVRHSRAEGGYCAISLTFVETGELAFPAATDSPGAQSLLAADAVQTSAIEDFGNGFSIDNLPEFAVTDAVDTAMVQLDALDAALTSVGGVLANPVGLLQSELSALLPTPLAYATRLFGLFSKAGAILTSAQSVDFNTLNFLRVFATLRATSGFGKASRGGTLTPTRITTLNNRDALSTLTRQALLVQSAGMSAAMPLPVYQDAIQLRKEMLTALDTEAETANDVTYAKLMDLRGKVYTDITARVHDSAHLLTVLPKDITPALALSYDLYESVDRESEIIVRNRIRHPGFIPVEKLKVLSA